MNTAAHQERERRRERKARAEAAAARRPRETIVLETDGPGGGAAIDISDLNTPDSLGNTQLHRAAQSGDAAAVRALLEAKATVQRANNRGWCVNQERRC